MKTPNLPSEPPDSRAPRTIDGRRFVWILFGMSLVVILLAIGTYLLVCHLRQKYGLPVS